MVGTRKRLSELLRPWIKIGEEAGPVVGSGSGAGVEEIKTEKITNWSQARTLRRLALMRSACQGKHTFAGPKKLAFLRMLRRAQQQGKVIVVVLPVSPIYVKEFLPSDVSRRFEESLSDLERRVPRASWVHLEKLPALNSNEYFWDFVHMNSDGQQIATDAFLSKIRARGLPTKQQ